MITFSDPHCCRVCYKNGKSYHMVPCCDLNKNRVLNMKYVMSTVTTKSIKYISSWAITKQYMTQLSETSYLIDMILK